ncbi:hypothetical protein CsatA_005734 [Cannabis sativa]
MSSADTDIFRVCYYVENKTGESCTVSYTNPDGVVTINVLANEKKFIGKLLGPSKGEGVTIKTSDYEANTWDVYTTGVVQGVHRIYLETQKNFTIHPSVTTRLSFDAQLKYVMYRDHIDVYNVGWIWDGYLFTLNNA